MEEQERSLPNIGSSDIAEGWLVSAPRGGFHYVGPASLIYFARCARQIVAESSLLKHPTHDEGGVRRYIQAAAFTSYKISHTLEANLQGHPVTVAAEGEDVSPAAIVQKSSNTGQIFAPSPRDEVLRNPANFDRILSDRLIDAYFARVHHNLPIIHRGTFQVHYEETFGQTSLAKQPGWACTLAMLYTLGAQTLEEQLPSSDELQQHYLSIVIRAGLGRLVLTSTLANVQALLLLALYQHNAGERNTAWILTGQAIRSAVALGLHRDGENGNFDPFERNIRRMVWWNLHLFEQYISLALGRPSFTDIDSASIILPDDSLEAGMGLPHQHLRYHIALSRFIVNIKQTVGAIAVHYQNPQRLVEWLPRVMAIHSDIINWKKHLPSSLTLNQTFHNLAHRRLVLTLLIWSDYLESILLRTYLLCRVSQQIKRIPDLPRDLTYPAELAVTAAQASVTKLLILADHGLLEGSLWLDYYAVQHTIMITALHFLGQKAPRDASSMRGSISRLMTIAQQMRLAPTFRIIMNVALQLACLAGIGPENPVQLASSDIATPTLGSTDNVATNIPHQQTGEIDAAAQIEHLFGPIPSSRRNSQSDLFPDLYEFDFGQQADNPWDFFDLDGLMGDAMQQDSLLSIPNHHVDSNAPES